MGMPFKFWHTFTFSLFVHRQIPYRCPMDPDNTNDKALLTNMSPNPKLAVQQVIAPLFLCLCDIVPEPND